MTISEWMASNKNGAVAVTAFGDLRSARDVAAEMSAYRR